MTAPTGNPYWSVSVLGSSPTAYITNIQSVNMRKDRRKLTDNYSAGTMTIIGRRPDLLPAGLLIGTKINAALVVPVSGGEYGEAWTFRIADIIIDYGITAAEDTYTIELEDAFAYLGRVSLPTTVITNGTDTDDAAGTIVAAAGLSFTGDPQTTTKTSGQTVTNDNALDVFQTLVNTEQAMVKATGDSIQWWARRRWIYQSDLYVFTDTGAANTLKYDRYIGRSLADNYANKVVVFPRGSSEVASGTGIFSYNLDAYAFDTQQAQDLADFLRGALSVDYLSPTGISYLLNGQDTSAWGPIKEGDVTQVEVTFRGTSSNNQVIGYQVFSTPEETRVELFLASSGFVNYLILDDTTYGKLDNNRLGW